MIIFLVMDRLAPAGDSLTTPKDKILLTAFNLNLMYSQSNTRSLNCQLLIFFGARIGITERLSKMYLRIFFSKEFKKRIDKLHLIS